MLVKRSYARSGFTLIEVLVVMAIIALLAALTFGSYGHVRENGRSATCQNNLHQMALAMQQYVQDYDGKYPNNHLENKPWEYELSAYLKDPRVFKCPSLVGLSLSYPGPPDGFNYEYNAPWLTHHRKGRVESFVAGHTATIWLNVCIDWTRAPVINGVRLLTPPVCGKTSMPLVGPFTHHSNGTNYSFVDGHVKWLTPEQIGQIDCANISP